MEINETELANMAAFVEAGLPVLSAAKKVGVSRYAIMAILEKGQREQLHRAMGGTKHVRAENAVKVFTVISRAEATAEERWVGNIDAAAPEDWKAAKFLLERHNPEVYGSTGEGGVATLDDISNQVK